MSVPNRCIWCLRGKDETKFDVSHVLPECVGNENMQILPDGIVCKECNNYFGTKIEPFLISDPLFHVIAVFLRLVDPEDMNEFRDHIFDTKHPAVGKITRSMHLDANVSSNNFTVDIQYGISGRLSKTYTRRELAFLSRAVHKIAYETLAWTIFVKGINTEIDIYSDEFNPVRNWSRGGSPVNRVRPVVRRQSFDKVSTEWSCSLWKFSNFIGIELNLFGDWYVVSLTSPVDRAEDDLRENIDASKQRAPAWVIGEDLKPLV